MPSLALGVRGGCARAAVPYVFTRPQQRPPLICRRCEEWLRGRIEWEVSPEIYQKQTVIACFTKITQHEGAGSEHCAVQVAPSLNAAQYRLFPPEMKQVSVQRKHRGVAGFFSLRVINLGT